MNSPIIKNTHWLDIAEIAAVLGSLAGSVASVVLNQFFWATIPLSASATLSLLNHQRLKKIINAEILKEQVAIANVVTENKENISNTIIKSQNQYQDLKSNISTLTSELEKMRDLATTELAILQQKGKDNFGRTSKELQKIEASLLQLDSLSSRLTENLDQVDRKQKETGKIVRELKAIDIFSQNIKSDLNSVQSYFERGLAYQRLGNKNRAIDDYSKTIELSNDHAKAYHHRGLLYLELGLDQKAIIDLRKASQLYFDKGDLDKYRETRDLSQTAYQQDEERSQLAENQTSNSSEQVVVGNLFG